MAEHGAFIWNELMTRDVEGAKAFYASVLGWGADVVDVGVGPYVLFKAGDTVVGGAMAMTEPQFDGIPPHWFAYVNVDDVDASTAAVAAAGGMVIRPPFDIPTVGRIAIVQDSTGAALGLMTPVPCDDH
ncbi:MAG: VOC family protein [Rhodobacterales bacterium]|nr:VOC family protein [Rhodobacterales bacterium]